MAKKSTPKKDAKQAKAKAARGKRTWKALGTVNGILVGIATTKALDATWRTATGHTPPNKPESPDIADREAMLWAAVSGLTMALTRTYATRRLARYWVRSTGELPPGMGEKGTKAEQLKVKQKTMA